MKITPNIPAALPAAAPVQEAAPAQAPATASQGSERQSAVLQAAQAALRDMPEVDEARVAELRGALARGEVHFDAGKLARLIARYHGVRE